MANTAKIFAWLSMQNLTGEELRILFNLMSRLDYDNYVKITQTQIANDMKLHKSSISRAINHMVELKIMIPGTKEGVMNKYRLNPYMADENPAVLTNKTAQEPSESSVMPLTRETQTMLQRINRRSGKIPA